MGLLEDVLAEAWTPLRYADRTHMLYQHCQAWLGGVTAADMFLADNKALLVDQAWLSIICEAGEGLAAEMLADQLMREFEMVVAIALSIVIAAEALYYDGYDADASVLVRAVYFADAWRDTGERLDGFPPLPVYTDQVLAETAAPQPDVASLKIAWLDSAQGLGEMVTVMEPAADWPRPPESVAARQLHLQF